jgi:SAM-dependent methyltransferase
LPPGTLLQLMYLKTRLRRMSPGYFIEIGPGLGHISALLLSLGWSGAVYEIEQSTIEVLQCRFREEISQGRFKVNAADWLSSPLPDPVDLVVSCMVMEHLDDTAEKAFVARARASLNVHGTLICIVPGSPAAWGIEDDIAGHLRRYTADALRERFAGHSWQVTHLAGLTFPLSNLLLPLSNYLVRKAEARKLSVSLLERTKQSGIRNVPMKTTFRPVLGVLLNERTLLPFHLLQKLFSRSKRAFVLYLEATPQQNGGSRD